MSGITPVIIYILAMVIMVGLQVVPGVFAIFYHFASGNHSRRKADDFGLDFILGAEIFAAVMWLLMYAISFAVFYDADEIFKTAASGCVAGVCFADAIIMYFWYFRRGKRTTETFLPRRVVRGVVSRASHAKTRVDAAALGFFAGVLELIFTLPLIFVCNMVLQNGELLPRAVLVILAVVIFVLPLFVVREFYRRGYNLAEIERKRIAAKPWVRMILCILYIVVGTLIIMTGVQNG